MTILSNNPLARQESLGLHVPSRAIVVGCGGVGSWVAIFLAMAGVPKLWLFDHDTVSTTNLNRLPVAAGAVDKPKSEALRDQIINLRPDCEVLACGGFSAELANSLNLGILSLSDNTMPAVIVSTDTLASRCMVHTWARDWGFPYIEAAAEGEYGSVTGCPAEWSTDAETQPGYASVPVHVGPCVMAAAMACYHVLHGKPLRGIHRTGWTGTGLEFFTHADSTPAPTANPDPPEDEEYDEYYELEEDESSDDTE